RGARASDTYELARGVRGTCEGYGRMRGGTCAILCACVPSGCFLPSRADLPSLARLPLVSRGVFIAGDYHSQGPDRVNGEETMTAAESADLAQRYDPRDVQEKWQGRWAGLDPFRPRRDPPGPPGGLSPGGPFPSHLGCRPHGAHAA